MNDPLIIAASTPNSNDQFYAEHAKDVFEILYPTVTWTDAIIGRHITRRDAKRSKEYRIFYILTDDPYPIEVIQRTNKISTPDLKPNSLVKVKYIFENDRYFIFAVKPNESNEPNNNVDRFPECIGVVTYFNKDKKVYHVTIGKEQETYFNRYVFNLYCTIGEFVKVKLCRGKNCYNVVAVGKTDSMPPTSYYKIIKNGKVSLHGDYFFVEDNIVIPYNLSKSFSICEGDLINGAAALTYNRKHDRFDWKLIKIIA